MYIPWIIIAIGIVIVWWMIEKRDALIEKRDARIQELEDLMSELNSTLEDALNRDDGDARIEELESLVRELHSSVEMHLTGRVHGKTRNRQIPTGGIRVRSVRFVKVTPTR